MTSRHQGGRLAGVSAIALAIAATLYSPAAFAQTSGQVSEAASNALLNRLNALEQKVQQLEQRNAELEGQVTVTNKRVQETEAKVTSAGKTNGVVPTFTDSSGNTTFKVRGVIDADYVGFNERRGGYDYNNGTAFRRARLGFEGTAFKDFNWKIEADFAGNSVNLQDVYVQYSGLKPLEITLGQHKAPFGLESNNSDNYNVFLERGMFNNAAGALTAERRIGLTLAYVSDNFTASANVSGENESISRASTASTTDTPDEGWGVNGRITWEPINQKGRVLHLGAAANWRTDLRTSSGAGTRLNDRPNVRVDGGSIIDSGTIADATDAHYVGAEAAGIFGPVTIASEYGKLWVERLGNAPTAHFDGYYVYGTFFLTGESRSFSDGNYSRIKPIHNFDGKGGWGAWELALRYDHADLSDTPVLANTGNKASNWTAGVNWYWNPNLKLQFNYIRFSGDNTPLDPVGAKTKGDAFATRLHIDW